MGMPLPPGTPTCSISTSPLAKVKPNVAPIVEFNQVSKTFNGRQKAATVLRDITFKVEDLENIGEFIAILGPSGCGKSTILRLIAGLAPQFPQTTGDLLVNGKTINGPGADRGMVFQDYTCFDNRTVLDNVAFGLECRGVSRTERHDMARIWIKKVGLDPQHDANKYPHELSGGMRQRVAIARTLILKPHIILMDEPFGALDPSTRYHMQDLLVSLWKEVEATVFLVTHDVAEAVFLGDRVFVMSNAPGTILHHFHVMPPDRPAQVIQREPSFQETVFMIRDLLATLEEGKE
jgi:NitT/TauT family transport system ATP-binding protein